MLAGALWPAGSHAARKAKVEAVALTVEHMTEPLAVGTTEPRFSWQIEAEGRGVVQKAYRILVATTPEKLRPGEADLWDSGDIETADQLWIAYRGARLRSTMRAYWTVSVATNVGRSPWAPAQMFGVGMTGETDWRGQWIGLETMQPGEARGMHTRLHARYLRKEFGVKGRVVSATAYVAGVGLNELYVEGHRMGGNHVLQPVPTDYRRTIYYNTYDLTPQLATMPVGSKATIGVVLEAGRYFAMRQEKAYKAPVFGLPTCRVNVVVAYADGSREVWATDASWRITTEGPIRSANEYDGEHYDARMELGAWATTGYDDSLWRKADRSALPTGTLMAQPTEGMTEQPLGAPLSVKPMTDGRSHIADFGQNIAGYVGLKIYGRRGDTIRIKYAERLDSDGNLYTANYRNARSEDIYVCNGTEQGREWHATFVYHGFRYVRITGPARLEASQLKAYVVADEMASIGNPSRETRFEAFECTDTVLNRVVRNAWWGIKDNYKGMPVDCPQRNERQPWLGDRTVGALGESMLFDNERLYAKWVRDICDAQRSDGCIPDVAPAFWNYYTDNVTWPAALPMVCDMLYTQYGNLKPIVEAYPHIKRWIDHITDTYVEDGIVTRDKYGDWCVPPEKPELIHSKDPARQTDGALISTAYMTGCMALAEKFARLQGLSDDAEMWHSRREAMVQAFNRRFLTRREGTSRRPGHVLYPDSVFYGNNTATANLLALAFDLVPEELRHEVAKNVVEAIVGRGDGKVVSGVIGVSWMMRTLSRMGFGDVAYLLATNDGYPSWGYMARQGATTIWELWNGDTANPAMNSGNHVMLLGDLLPWCYETLAGIGQGRGVGYKHIVMKPDFGLQNCFSARGTMLTPYGRVSSAWTKEGREVTWTIELPPNTSATIYLPDGRRDSVGSGRYTFSGTLPTRDSRIVTDEFVYDQAAFPQAHASTIVETKRGDLVAAYFGGTKERDADVCIYVSRKPRGAKRWQAPVLAADGVAMPGSPQAEAAGIVATGTPAWRGPVKQHPEWRYSFGHRRSLNAPLNADTLLRRKACWNPVLFEMPDGELWLFFKIGDKVADWSGWVTKSRDGGRTWSDKEPLPHGFLGPIKNKPELVGHRLLCPSSTEGGKNGWEFHTEIYDLETRRWSYVGPVEADTALLTEDMDPKTTDIMHPIAKQGARQKTIDCIQPSILRLADGRLQVLMRTRNGRLATSYSSDRGETWTRVSLTGVENNQSGTDAVTLRDGRHVLIYNNFETLPGTKKGVRTPLSIAVSDDGTTWRHVMTLEDSAVGQYSYPAIIEGRDGSLHCVYTWRRQKIKYQRIKLDQ